MTRILRILFSGCFALALCGCETKVAFSDLPSAFVPVDFDSLVEIKNWIAIGPFKFDTLAVSQKKSFLIDDLSRYGITEGTTDRKALKKLQRKGVDAFLIIMALIEQMKDSVARIKIDNRYADDFASAIRKVDYVNEMYIDTIFANSINYVNRNKVFWGHSLYKQKTLLTAKRYT